MVITTLLFSAAALPAGDGLVTKILEVLAGAPTELVSIRSVDEVRAWGGQGPGCGGAGLGAACCVGWGGGWCLA